MGDGAGGGSASRPTEEEDEDEDDEKAAFEALAFAEAAASASAFAEGFEIIGRHVGECTNSIVRRFSGGSGPGETEGTAGTTDNTSTAGIGSRAITSAGVGVGVGTRPRQRQRPTGGSHSDDGTSTSTSTSTSTNTSSSSALPSIATAAPAPAPADPTAPTPQTAPCHPAHPHPCPSVCSSSSSASTRSRSHSHSHMSGSVSNNSLTGQISDSGSSTEQSTAGNDSNLPSDRDREQGGEGEGEGEGEGDGDGDGEAGKCACGIVNIRDGRAACRGRRGRTEDEPPRQQQPRREQRHEQDEDGSGRAETETSTRADDDGGVQLGHNQQQQQQQQQFRRQQQLQSASSILDGRRAEGHDEEGGERRHRSTSPKVPLHLQRRDDVRGLHQNLCHALGRDRRRDRLRPASDDGPEEEDGGDDRVNVNANGGRSNGDGPRWNCERRANCSNCSNGSNGVTGGVGVAGEGHRRNDDDDGGRGRGRGRSLCHPPSLSRESSDFFSRSNTELDDCSSADGGRDGSNGGDGDDDDGGGRGELRHARYTHAHAHASSPPERDVFFSRSLTEDHNGDENDDGDDDSDAIVEDINDKVRQRLASSSSSLLETDSFFCRSLREYIDSHDGGGKKADAKADAKADGVKAEKGQGGEDAADCRMQVIDADTNGSINKTSPADDDGTGTRPGATADTAGARSKDTAALDRGGAGMDNSRRTIAFVEPDPEPAEIAATATLSPLHVPDDLPATPKSSIARRAVSEGQYLPSLGTPPRTPQTPQPQPQPESQPNQQQQPFVLPRSPGSFLFSSPEKIRPLGRVASAVTLSALRQSISQSNINTITTPVKNMVMANRRRATELMKRRRAKREARLKAAQSSPPPPPPRHPFIIIPADHPVKIAWDVVTVILTIISAYQTHQSIRDRTYEQSPFVVFIEFWFLLDILLNFVTEHKTSDGQIIRDGKAIWARYLTSWFVIDALSVVPWERIYVRPIVERQKRRNIFTKTFFRSKSVVRVTRLLRGRHLKLFKLFGKVAKQSKQVGVGGQRLLRLIIKYVPKYLLFYRNMRSVLVVRTLRQVHFFRKVWKQLVVTVRTEPLQIIRRPGKVFAAARRANDADLDCEDDDNDDDADFDDEDSSSLLDDNGDRQDFEEYMNDDEYIGADGDEDVDYIMGMGEEKCGAADGGKDCRVVLLPKLDDYFLPSGKNGSTGDGNNDDASVALGASGSAVSSSSSGEPVLRFRAAAKSKRPMSIVGGAELFAPLS